MSKSDKKRANGGKGQSSLTRKKLIEFLSKTAQLERKLQVIKQMLAEQPDFTPASLFHRLDRARKRYINEQDIQDFLIDSKIQYKGSELKTLFGRIDVNRNQAISVREFQDFILPNQNPRLRYQCVRRPVLIPLPIEKLSEKIEWITAKFFTEIIHEYTNLMAYNNSLVSSFDFNVGDIFAMLSGDGHAIKSQDIRRFMEDNNVELSPQELGCLIKLIDKKGEGHIYIDDFKVYLATLGLKKQHEIFDELSPIPALKEYHEKQINSMVKDRDRTLRERYKDNKSYVRGMDVQGHHVMGYSRVIDQSHIKGPAWVNGGSSEKKRMGGDG